MSRAVSLLASASICAGMVFLYACGASEPRAPAPERVDEAASVGTTGGERHFGERIGEELPVTALSSMMGDPTSYDGQRVKTEGEITQVCQRMGCWMELRPSDGGGGAVRVPMAGHSFFLPRDVAGHRATVVGDVEVRELDPETQAHLESEGAEAASAALGISAVSVVVH